MHKSLIHKLTRYSFILSVILHLLLILSFTTVVMMYPEENKKPPQLYTPAYVYTGAINQTSVQQQTEKPPIAQRAEKNIPAQKIKKAKKAWFPRKDANF